MIKSLSVLVFFLFTSPLAAVELVSLETQTMLSGADQEGGNTSSIGGDLVDARKLSAWFYGDKEIITCITHVKAFGVKRSTVSKEVRSAIKTWQKYFKDKKNKSADTKKSVSLHFKVADKCTGDEDLRLHFGTGPIYGNERDVRTTHSLHAPVALANKTHVSKDKTWSKGYIRFVAQGYYQKGKKTLPDWKKKNALQTMIIHELGHVLGFIHTSGTVMEASISSQLFSDKKPRVLSVDQKNELVFCSSCSEKFVAKNLEQDQKEWFKRLGVSPQKAVVSRHGKKYWIGQGKKQRGIKILESDVVSKRKVQLMHFSSKKPAEQVSLQEKGVIKDLSGKEHLVLINYNWRKNESLLSLTLVEGKRFVKMGNFDRVINQ